MVFLNPPTGYTISEDLKTKLWRCLVKEIMTLAAGVAAGILIAALVSKMMTPKTATPAV